MSLVGVLYTGTLHVLGLLRIVEEELIQAIGGEVLGRLRLRVR
jgi:hypothetical protein